MPVKLTEKYVKDQIKTIITMYSKYNSIYTLCPMTFGYGESGHPDRLILVQGRLLGVEVKKDHNNSHTRPELKASPSEAAQKIQAAKIAAAGGEWMCVHYGNLWELVKWLDAAVDKGQDMFDAKDREKLLALLQKAAS